MSASPSRGPGLAALSVAGLVLIVAAGAVHGRLTQRWGPGDELRRAAEGVASLPERIGDWRMEQEEKLPGAVLETLQCAGYVSRSYVNDKTGQGVRVAILVGPPGPIAVHTPEVCFASRDYRLKSAAERLPYEASDGAHAFWEARFESVRPGGADLTACYAWTADGVWRAAEAPRFEFAGRPALSKLQVAGSSGSPAPGAPKGDDPCRDFLRALVASPWRLLPAGT